MKIACFYDFLRKNQFLPIFYTQNDHFSIFVGALTLWRHSDVRHKWLVLILVSMERGCPYLYTGSKFRVIWPSVLIIQGGVATTPLRKICSGKTLRRTRVNFVYPLLPHPLTITNRNKIFPLTGSQRQKRKSKFFTRPCHKEYRVEAVGVSVSNYTFRIAMFFRIDSNHDSYVFHLCTQ